MVLVSDLLKDRVALITGGGTGIGYGIAEELARCGADVAVASRKPERVAAAAERLATLGVRTAAIEANVRDPDSVQAMVAQTVERLGRLDILVNNAAGNFYAPSAELTPNGWGAVVETDLYGTFFCSQAAYRVMRKQRSGRIISISMTLHYRGWPMMAHATAAKAGVDALTRTLALEWAADGITVNALAPGPILTEGARKAFAAGDAAQGSRSIDEQLATQIPVGRLGTPADIGRMAAYLASDAGAWITGSIIVIDGGSSLAKM